MRDACWRLKKRVEKKATTRQRSTRFSYNLKDLRLVQFSFEMETKATSNGENYKAKKPRPLLSRAWSENCEEVEVPGTPKTPRTSTTPGIFKHKHSKKNYSFKNFRESQLRNYYLQSVLNKCKFLVFLWNVFDLFISQCTKQVFIC